MVEVFKENRTAFITLNRPEKRNALNAALVVALQEAFDEALQDSGTRVIQLQGAGTVFCAGADLAAIQEMRNYSEAENRSDSEQLARLFLTVYTSPKPVIAAVKGAALAGGCGLASVCDISVAEETAKFGYTETRLGFVPAIVSVIAIRKLGETAARRLLLGAEIISGTEAARIGLVTEAVEAAHFEARLDFWRTTFTGTVSGEAVAATKALLLKTYDLPVGAAIDEAVAVNVRARGSADCRLGIDRFLRGEKNVW